jgi:hypothetical protein
MMESDTPYVQIQFGKTKAARRQVPLNAVASAILKARLESAKGVYLFPHRTDVDKPMLKVNNAHTTALRKCKCPIFACTTVGTLLPPVRLKAEWTLPSSPRFWAVRN